jgi:hypothetical protein
MYTSYISNYYLCDFLEIIDKKLEKSDGTYNNMYIIYVKRYVIKTYSVLGR